PSIHEGFNLTVRVQIDFLESLPEGLPALLLTEGIVILRFHSRNGQDHACLPVNAVDPLEPASAYPLSRLLRHCLPPIRNQLVTRFELVSREQNITLLQLFQAPHNGDNWFTPGEKPHAERILGSGRRGTRVGAPRESGLPADQCGRDPSGAHWAALADPTWHL